MLNLTSIGLIYLVCFKSTIYVHTRHFGLYKESKLIGRYSAVRSTQLSWAGQYNKCVQYVFKFTSEYSDTELATLCMYCYFCIQQEPFCPNSWIFFQIIWILPFFKFFATIYTYSYFLSFLYIFLFNVFFLMFSLVNVYIYIYTLTIYI